LKYCRYRTIIHVHTALLQNLEINAMYTKSVLMYQA